MNTKSAAGMEPQPKRSIAKSTGDPEQSRSRIFDAAEMLFAEHGYAGTGVQAIVDRAHINKRMLYYYFGNKLDLYNAVVQHNFNQMLGPVAAAGRSALASSGPVAALAVVVREHFDALWAHPRYLRLLRWADADAWSTLNTLPHQAVDDLRDLLICILREGMAAGVFDRNLDPVGAWSYLIGMSTSYFNYRPRLQIYAEGDLADPMVVVRFRHAIVRFALLGVGTARDTADEVVAQVAPTDMREAPARLQTRAGSRTVRAAGRSKLGSPSAP